MKYQILKFRYDDDMTHVCFKDTYEEAVQEIDRLAKLRSKPSKGFLEWLDRVGDSIHYTFRPIGG
jgi:hypothetical protein